MSTHPRVICTVTNDLSYDQRMHRIASTLVESGWEVWLVGRYRPQSTPLQERPFHQIRLRCWTHKGFLFYAEFNLRLFFFLLKTPFKVVNTVDLDTMPAGALAGYLKGAKGIFDAHEYFTEVPEVVHRPFVRGFWRWVERLFISFYEKAYTVGPALAQLFTEQHRLPFDVIRNVPHRLPSPAQRTDTEIRLLFYQGALNEGRGLEAMVDTMAWLPENFQFVLAGEGDLSVALRERAHPYGERIRFLGFVEPEALKLLTKEAWIGINLLENKGLSYYYSLANKFFDTVQARIPLLTMDFPEYRALCNQYPVAILVQQLNPEQLAKELLALDRNPSRYRSMVDACEMASNEWNWDIESKKLVNIWQDLKK